VPTRHAELPQTAPLAPPPSAIPSPTLRTQCPLRFPPPPLPSYQRRAPSSRNSRAWQIPPLAIRSTVSRKPLPQLPHPPQCPPPPAQSAPPPLPQLQRARRVLADAGKWPRHSHPTIPVSNTSVSIDLQSIRAFPHPCSCRPDPRRHRHRQLQLWLVVAAGWV
jgi:hypothetical protein